MKCDSKYLQLYAVTDRSWIGEKTVALQVEEALRGGVTCVQLREKELDDASFLQEAYEIKELCRKYRVPFIVNDSVDIAIKSDADGIHVGQNDMCAKDVRKLISNDMLLGVSVQTVEQALLAEQNGANYVGVGAMFHTSTKNDADSIDFQTLNEICRAVSIPVVAIGGINKNNILKLNGIGVDGVALVSAIFSSSNIKEECRELRKKVEQLVAL